MYVYIYSIYTYGQLLPILSTAGDFLDRKSGRPT